MRIIVLLSFLLLLSLPALAQTKYSAWSDPDGKNDGELVERLNELIDQAEKDRAADPAFLRDLRDLARGYSAQPQAASQPVSRTVLSDDFGDGNFTVNPVWSVTAGRYWVENGWGLRSAVPVQSTNQPQVKSRKERNRDTAIALLGAVLGQAGGGGTTTTTTTTGNEFAAIHTPAAIANAFTLELEFSSWAQKGQPVGGRFEIGPYQGSDQKSGYRLSYTPGKGLTLMIATPRERRVIDQQAGPMTLEDEKFHTLRWTRDGRGKMVISVDGRTVLSTTDRGFGDPFHGLMLSNGGGDFIIKRISVSNGG